MRLLPNNNTTTNIRATLTRRRKMAAASKATGCVWYQREVIIPPKSRGCHYITDTVKKQCPEIQQISIGIAHLTIQHTSASICLNEKMKYRHTCEGPDDMPAHVKAALIGSTLTIPISNGEFKLGTWQGIWLCEHRNHAGSRRIAVTIQGSEN